MAAATPKEMASWPAPNYEDPETRGCIVIGMAAPTLALVIVFSAMRFYGRGVLRKALGKDDWMMFAAAVRLFDIETQPILNDAPLASSNCVRRYWLKTAS